MKSNNPLSDSYNTQLEPIIFKEYGRGVQELVKHALTIADRKQQTIFCRTIIDIMGELHPNLSNTEEFSQKLWDHLHIMADFQLNIDSPFPKPTPEEVKRKVGHVPYPQGSIRYRHYGKNVENLIKKAVLLPDGPKKTAFAKVIANYMRMVYKVFSSDGTTDEFIKDDLLRLSNGQLDLIDSTDMDIPKSNKRKRKGKGGGSNMGGNNNGHDKKSSSTQQQSKQPQQQRFFKKKR